LPGYINSGYLTVGGLAELLEHEFGHILGLSDEGAGCGGPTVMMNSGTYCVPSSLSSTVSAGDAAAAAAFCADSPQCSAQPRGVVANTQECPCTAPSGSQFAGTEDDDGGCNAPAASRARPTTAGAAPRASATTAAAACRRRASMPTTSPATRRIARAASATETGAASAETGTVGAVGALPAPTWSPTSSPARSVAILHTLPASLRPTAPRAGTAITTTAPLVACPVTQTIPSAGACWLPTLARPTAVA
jgi:hypothetical protein